MKPEQRLKERVELQTERLERSHEKRSSVLAQTAQLGTLGLVFVLPVVGGAYLGRWMDEQLAGYSTSWTLSLIILGVIVGSTNVYLAIRRSD